MGMSEGIPGDGAGRDQAFTAASLAHGRDTTCGLVVCVRSDKWPCCFLWQHTARQGGREPEPEALGNCSMKEPLETRAIHSSSTPGWLKPGGCPEPCG